MDRCQSQPPNGTSEEAQTQTDKLLDRSFCLASAFAWISSQAEALVSVFVCLLEASEWEPAEEDPLAAQWVTLYARAGSNSRATCRVV